VRDSGVTHTLLGLAMTSNCWAILLQAQAGKAFCHRTSIAAAPAGTTANFYRTAAGAEIDLLLTLPGRRPWEIERSLSPTLEKGFYLACTDLDVASDQRTRRSICRPSRVIQSSTQ